MATAGFPIGGGHQNPSHRGHGFAFGHPQFAMPSQTAPTRNATITHARQWETIMVARSMVAVPAQLVTASASANRAGATVTARLQSQPQLRV